MFYIVDASVVAEFLIVGPHTPNTQAFFKGALAGDLFTVPELCLNECANVIWKAVRDLKALPLKRAPTKAVLDTALAIGLRHNLAIYDLLYIALAVRSRNVFVTLDEPQSRAAIAEGVSVTPITNFT